MMKNSILIKKIKYLIQYFPTNLLNMQNTGDNTRSAPFLPSQTTNFCISKFGQWNLKLNRKTAEDFELIQAFVIKQQEQAAETVAVEGTKDQRRKPKVAQLTAYDRMQQARAKKHSEKVRAAAAMLEVDDEVEKCLAEMYEDFPTAHGVIGEPHQAKEGMKESTKPKGDDTRTSNTRTWSRECGNRGENKSAAFLSVSRSDTAMSKAVARGKGYNTDIAYRPKYNLVEKAVASAIKYEKRIPFFDSRFDIFYGQDREYTQQMLLEDEMAGGQYSLIQNQEEKSNSKSQAAANAYSGGQEGSRGAAANDGTRHPQSSKRLKTLQKLYMSYQQSQQLAENKQSAEVSREQQGVLHLKKQLSKPMASTMQKFNPSSKSFHSVAPLVTKAPRQPRTKSNLPTAAHPSEKHDAESSRSRGSHKSQGSEDAANKAPKDKKQALSNSRTQQIQSVSHWNLEKFAFDLQQNNTEFHQTVHGSSARWPGEMGRLDVNQAKHHAQKSRNHMLSKAKPHKQAVTTKSLQGSFNTLLDFHRMKPRDEGWISASAKNLNGQRFACNFSKLPTILSNVKKGECIAEFGPATASRLLDMKHGQRSRDEAKIIHPCFDQMPDYSTAKQNSTSAYDVSYALVERNANSEYASTFLKKAGRAPAAEAAAYSRFEDNCQHKTLRTCSDFSRPNADTRPGLYSVATQKQDQPSIIDYGRSVSGFASLSHCPRAIAHDFSASLEREHEPSFMNKYIVNQHTEDVSIDNLSYQDFLPNSIQRKIKKNSKINQNWL